MKLKEIYNQVQADQNQPQINIEEVKMRFNEQISTFKQLGEGLYNLSNYKKIAEQLSSLAESAEQYLISESDSWFDNITIKRNLKELKNYTVDFNKVSGEAQALQERMAALYEDMGVILNRYFDVPDSVKENSYSDSAAPKTPHPDSAAPKTPHPDSALGKSFAPPAKGSRMSLPASVRLLKIKNPENGEYTSISYALTLNKNHPLHKAALKLVKQKMGSGSFINESPILTPDSMGRLQSEYNSNPEFKAIIDKNGGIPRAFGSREVADFISKNIDL